MSVSSRSLSAESDEEVSFSSYLASISIMSTSGKTAKTYKTGLIHFKEFAYKNYQIEITKLVMQIKNGDLDVYKILNEFAVYLHGLKMKPATFKPYMAGVKGFLRYERIKIHSEEVKQLVKTPKNRRYREEPLTKEILVKLLHVVPFKLQTIILVATSSGMRIGELVQLKISDINFEKNPTEINIRADTTKTKESRVAYITTEATKALKDYLTRYFEWQEGKSNQAMQNRMIFDRTSKNKNGEPIEFKSLDVATSGLEQSLRRHIAKIPELSRLNENGRKMIHFHAFRKYCRTVVGDISGRDFAEALIGHRFYLDTYYLQSEEKRRELYLKAEPYLTISDYTQVEKKLNKISEKYLEIQETLAKIGVKLPDMYEKSIVG